MNDILISRPSHYQMLGIEPDAGADEIERAFARRISLFTPTAFGNVTMYGIAYETLRDPVKREKYDRSIGIEPRPRQGLPSLRPGQALFIAKQHRDPQERRADDHAITMRPVAEATPEPKPEPAPTSTTPPSQSETELILRDILARRTEPERALNLPIDWKKTGLAVGGVVFAVAVLGAWAGWQAGNDVEAQKIEAGVNLALPPAKEREAAIAPILTVPSDMYEAPSPRASPRNSRARRTPAPSAHETLDSIVEPSPEGEPVSGQISDGVAAPSAVTQAAAALPLSNRTVAKTLERIGYSCGDVASTSAAGAGAFKVTCTSGNSYQATPVKGRYRFRRL